MEDETAPRSTRWRRRTAVDLYDWTRDLALRIAMRALFGLDPTPRRRVDAAHEFEAALSFYGRDYHAAGPARAGLAVARMLKARKRLDAHHLRARSRGRRASGERGEDLLSLLLDATDEDGAAPLRPAHPRRGHDAAVRRPRHDDLDDRLPLLRAARKQPDAIASSTSTC